VPPLPLGDGLRLSANVRAEWEDAVAKHQAKGHAATTQRGAIPGEHPLTYADVC